ncbi:flagellar hook-associated protein 3 [Aliarcobacter trophiarum LMG 25534]|uniref:Distal flagellar hook-filament junction protein n=1 Tax=Aliarcobacter trophiarum LMG 25534 TaxID=1032241 RepID=A0AAD0QKF1_9BACT|nr:flagellar hook-associated protein FlgL [Aliarcobacter trophiarum]AXK49462.1 distal flagellar hook-filament junction protein [Aliarcobacter trophiarum LMG 25534]RXI27929.1 flagellar hook-associated protein 3 [Aliarcobacter trophiarum]RXJ91293.1 flagellar hook-associated protein 3 [Aliarcobacter trophiarum LMG 25534]
MISLDSTNYRLGNMDRYQSKLNFQMGGRKLQFGSDDSVTFGRLVHTDDKIKTQTGIKAQIERADVLNKTSDTAMKEVKNLLEKIKAEELIKANTSTTSIEGLEAIAKVIEGYKQNIFDLANTQTEGQYVFAGSDASIKPFSMDASGKVTYNGDSSLRKIAIDDGSYRERGINGIDAFFYVANSGLKGDTLSFKENDKIIDQDGKEWMFDSVANTLTKTNWDGSTETLTVTPPVAPSTEYTTTLPNVDGTKFEAKRSTFDMLDDAIKSLRGLDALGNPTLTYEERRAGISEAIDNATKSYDSAIIAHSDLGAKNKTFEVSQERLESRITQLKALDIELGNSNLSEVAVELKSLEISYAALYSTINRTFELSLVNFMR